MTIHQALIMAAGHATRMRPLTDDLPKPLLKINNIPLLTHIINHLMAEDVTHIIINGYHAIDPLIDYIDDIKKRYPQCDFTLSQESELLETGGGAVNALHYLDKDEPFYMINGDAFWINSKGERTLGALARQWSGNKQSILLLLQSCSSMKMTGAVGDYTLNDGIAKRSLAQDGDYMFTGVRVCTPKILSDYPIEKFSFLKIMDDAQAANQLAGVNHRGEWYHISTPSDLADVNNALYAEKEPA